MKSITPQFVLVLVVFISLLSCNQKDSTPKLNDVPKEEKFTLPSSEYVILNYQKLNYSYLESGIPTQLSPTELINIEEILKIAVNTHNDNEKKLLAIHNTKYPEQQRTETGAEIKLDGYKRQYLPTINSEGEKEVWINFFCDTWGADDWKEEIIIVKDGGNCYYNLKVNLTKKNYSQLMVNGEA